MRRRTPPASAASAFALVAAAFLAACAVGPDYTAPEPAAGEWAARPAAATSDPAPADWWRLLDEPALEAYVARALERNHDLRIAEARLAEARAARGVARSVFWPQIGAEGRYTWYEQSLRSPGAASQLVEAGLSERTDEVWNTTLDASWEIDLFGGTRRRAEAAGARVAAAAAERDGTRLAVIAEVVSSYMELRGAQTQKRLAANNLRLQSETLEITEGKVRVGLSRELDALRARAQLESTRASIPPLDAAIKAAAHRLAVLTGEPPETLLAELLDPEPLAALPRELPVGLRADLLRRRPDIRAAERSLAAATADVGAATAEFFPSLVLNATGGFEAANTADLFDAPARTRAYVPFLRWPVFQGGRLRAELAAADARAAAALAGYERAVLLALEDAENAFAAYAEEARTLAALDASVEASREAADIARRLYENGLADFLTVLDAERELTEVEDAYSQSATRLRLNFVRLYKALGGGWEI